MRKTLTVFVILAIRPAPPVSFRVGTECTDQLYGRLHDSLWQDMASDRVPVRLSVGPLVWFLLLSDPEYQTWNLRVSFTRHILPTTFLHQPG